MVYRINGTELDTQPTRGQWVERPRLAEDGNLHAIYPLFFDYELQWNVISVADYNQLHTFFDNQGNTGTVTIDLPEYGGATYTFVSYTGCVLRQPSAGDFFSAYVTDARLSITRIRT